MTSGELSSERLALRPVEPDDVDALLSIRRSPWVSQWWGDGSNEPGWPFDDDDSTSYTIWRNGEVAGLIQHYEVTSPSVRYAGIDLFLAESASRQGLGQEAVRRVMRHLMDDRGHHRIVIDPSAANVRAIATYAACGFEPVGVMRKYEKNTDGSGWHDAVFMEYVT